MMGSILWIADILSAHPMNPSSFRLAILFLAVSSVNAQSTLIESSIGGDGADSDAGIC